MMTVQKQSNQNFGSSVAFT